MSNKIKVKTKINDNVAGNWVEVGNDLTIAAFVQTGIPACTIYEKEKSNMYLVFLDGKLQLQFEDKDGDVFWLDAADLQTHVDYKKKEASKKSKEKDKEPA